MLMNGHDIFQVCVKTDRRNLIDTFMDKGKKF